jgi:hypothetical protein
MMMIVVIPIKSQILKKMGLDLYVQPPRWRYRQCKKTKYNHPSENGIHFLHFTYSGFSFVRDTILARTRGAPLLEWQLENHRVGGIPLTPHGPRHPKYNEDVHGPVLDMLMKHSDCCGEFTTKQCEELLDFFITFNDVLTQDEVYADEWLFGLRLAVECRGQIIFA